MEPPGEILLPPDILSQHILIVFVSSILCRITVNWNSISSKLLNENIKLLAILRQLKGCMAHFSTRINTVKTIAILNKLNFSLFEIPGYLINHSVVVLFVLKILYMSSVSLHVTI